VNNKQQEKQKKQIKQDHTHTHTRTYTHNLQEVSNNKKQEKCKKETKQEDKQGARKRKQRKRIKKKGARKKEERRKEASRQTTARPNLTHCRGVIVESEPKVEDATFNALPRFVRNVPILGARTVKFWNGTDRRVGKRHELVCSTQIFNLFYNTEIQNGSRAAIKTQLIGIAQLSTRAPSPPDDAKKGLGCSMFVPKTIRTQSDKTQLDTNPP
jgi:hypothetical protein